MNVCARGLPALVVFDMRKQLPGHPLTWVFLASPGPNMSDDEALLSKMVDLLSKHEIAHDGYRVKRNYAIRPHTDL